jgi:hypothetical protein
VTVLLDDHLLRAWLGGADAALREAIGRDLVATTNLWYARLCKGMASYRGVGLSNWPSRERQALIARLVALPEQVTVVPMRQLAWRMGELIASHAGLSTLGAEVVASGQALDAQVLVSSRNVGPGIRRCCEAVGVRHSIVAR